MTGYVMAKKLGLGHVACGLIALAFGGTAMAQTSLGMLETLKSGAWELRYRDGTPPRRLCLKSGRELIRLRHPRGNCNRFVVEDNRNSVTVQYTCRGDGYGRTAIRREANGLVQIESQGIKGGRPFQFSAEARRLGRCN